MRQTTILGQGHMSFFRIGQRVPHGGGGGGGGCTRGSLTPLVRGSKRLPPEQF